MVNIKVNLLLSVLVLLEILILTILFKKKLKVLVRTTENINDPLFRFFDREINSTLELATIVQADVSDVVEICQGNKKPTNHHRNLMSDLSKGDF